MTTVRRPGHGHGTTLGRALPAAALRRIVAVATLAALPAWPGGPSLAATADEQDLEAVRVAPFAVTPSRIVDEMLKLAHVGRDDFVIDLGSGDGRIVIASVHEFGAAGGLGVDISQDAVAYANAKAAEAGIADRVRFERRDLFATDVTQATVVTVYLFPAAMPRLREKLRAELRPGARIVVHDFPFPDWPPDRVTSFPTPEKYDVVGRGHATLYLYTVPARAPRQ